MLSCMSSEGAQANAVLPHCSGTVLCKGQEIRVLCVMLENEPGDSGLSGIKSNLHRAL